MKFITKKTELTRSAPISRQFLLPFWRHPVGCHQAFLLTWNQRSPKAGTAPGRRGRSSALDVSMVLYHPLDTVTAKVVHRMDLP